MMRAPKWMQGEFPSCPLCGSRNAPEDGSHKHVAQRVERCDESGINFEKGRVMARRVWAVEHDGHVIEADVKPDCRLSEGEVLVEYVPADIAERALLLAERLTAIGGVLADNGCYCECDHDSESHDGDCERCLGCRIAEAGRLNAATTTELAALRAELDK